MKMIQSVAFPFIAIVVCMTVLSGCNTVKGLGQDMQQGGRELQKAAYENSSH